MRTTLTTKSLFLLLGGLVLSAVSANAQTTTMTANSDWATGTWDNGVPGIGNDAVIAAGVAGTANNTVAAWSGSLTLDSGSTLTVSPTLGVGALSNATSITLNNASIINALTNTTMPAITLSGGGGFTQNGTTATHSRNVTFGGAITGNGGFTVEGNNKNRITFSVTNSFTGGLISNARDRHVIQFDAAGSAGAGDVTVFARNGNLPTERSATLDLRANNVFATSAILTLNGVGSDGWNYSAGQLLDMNTFDATVSGLIVNGVVKAAGDYVGGSESWIIGTGTLTVTSGGSDTTPPTITGADIADDVSGGPILVNHGTVTYTLSFSEAMDAASITTADFENGGTATTTIDQVNTTANPAVFEVEVTPSTVGTLILQIQAGAVIEDLAGNDLDTGSAISDDTTIDVDPIPPSPPLITGKTPDDDSFSVPLTTDLVIVFDETVQKGSGNIYVRTGGSPVQAIEVTTSAVTLSTTNATDDTVTVDISDLVIDTDYAIQIDAGAFEDTEATDFAGIGDDTTWNFSTGTPPPSSIVSFSAENGTTGPNTPPILDNSFGTLEMALNLGGANITYDGISFTGNTVTSGTNVVTWATVGGISVGGTTDVGATWNTATNIVSGSPGGSGEYNATFGTEAWSNKSGGGVFQTINISGLDAGKSYQIQLMHGEDRSIGNGFDYAGTLVATDENSNTADVFFRFGDENDQNTYVFGLVTLVVSGTTSVDILYPDRSVAASGDRDPSIAGIVIHSATGGPTNPYDTWAAINAPTGNPGDDFDGDGVSNAVEFVLGGDKDTNDLDKLPTVGASGGNMTFSFVRDQSSIDASTVVSIEVSTDLATWDTAPSPYAVPDTATAGPPVAVVDNADGTDTVTLTVAQVPDARKFARLKVVIVP